MKVGPAADVHLTYCTNIHAGETWAEVRRIVEQHVTLVKQRVSPNAPFGVGLRLSAQAARGLAAPGALDEFRSMLARHDLYVFTINGFPHGNFHGKRVKENVYRPDWSEGSRLAYTRGLTRLLAELLPHGLEGSISTVPIGFRSRFDDAFARDRATSALLDHAADLHALHESRGVTIGLALEPEPACRLETTAEAVAYFEREVLSRVAIEGHARRLGCSRSNAEASLRRHLGLCLDTCHAAVQFEDANESIERIERAGIRILKVQVTAGLRVTPVTRDALTTLRAFADDVYLHQVVVRRGDDLERRLDLPAVLAAIDDPASAGDEWRVHFHVPLFLEALSPLGGTHAFAEQVLARQRIAPLTRHLEVETYTWDVLPERYRHDDVETGIERELHWVSERLRP